jgi:hypothetical protein
LGSKLTGDPVELPIRSLTPLSEVSVVIRKMAFPSYNPLTNGITTWEPGAVNFTMVGPRLAEGAASAYLVVVKGRAINIVAMIDAINAIFAVLAFTLVRLFSNVKVSSITYTRPSYENNKDSYKFH